MKLRKLVLTAAAAALVSGSMLATQAYAAESIYIPLLTYRTGAYAGSGIPIADGMHDYFTMLNERDGGIGGVKLEIEECETGYNAQKGVECYEATKGKGAVVYNPYSTGITLQLIPKAPVDQIPVLSMGYGLSAAAVGEKFPWTFNVPATYWDQASAIIKYIDQSVGVKGKKIGFIYLDAGYGREPIPLFEALSKEMGFSLVKIPVAGKEMQNQSSHWLQVRKEKPDWMVMWGWGAMNPTAIKEAAKIKFPMDKFIGVWWSGGDDDARPAGSGAVGYRSVNFHATGTDYPALQDILKYVVRAGKSQVADESKVGENLYNRGMMNAVFVAEAIRVAQQKTGKKVISGADMRIGLENLQLTEARLKEIGLDGFTIPMSTNCTDHAGSHPVYIQKWNGKNWERASDWITPMTQRVRGLLETAADKY
ncbi:MAG: ABC transporter substrate-binding protein, partial [Gammaproteobacteria bacterium]|nr:ABC transporter substrate-binding protein [Gammaproteobacteria bacterium]